jgi:hypothetical protein
LEDFMLNTHAPGVASRDAHHASHADATANLLKAGTVAGAFYTVVGAAQVVLRDGFDIRRHALSLLTNGDFGWVQVVNFVATGTLVIAAAVGLRRALGRSRLASGATWVGRLLTVHGAGLIAAGVFRADPADGFPPGTPEGPGPISWHGLLHLAAGGIGFACFVAACFVLARRFSGQGDRGWAVFSRVTGVAFSAAFIGIASGSTGPATLAFAAAILLSWAWLAMVCHKALNELHDDTGGVS